MGFIDDILGKTAAEKQSKNFKSGINQLDFLQQFLQGGKGEIGSLLQGLIGDVGAGYDQAISQASGIGSGAYQSVLDQGQQATSAVQSGMMDRGLYNSTASLNAERGVAADTTRALADVNSNVAGLMAQLQAAKTNAMAGATTGLAGFLGQNLAQQGNVYGAKSNAYLNREIPQKYGGLMGGLGAIGGSIFGPAGSAIGGNLAKYFDPEFGDN